MLVYQNIKEDFTYQVLLAGYKMQQQQGAQEAWAFPGEYCRAWMLGYCNIPF